MEKSRYTLVDLVLGAYVLLPTFFRAGPVSIYQLLIIGIFVLYCFGSSQGNLRVHSRISWVVRTALLFIPMLYHREITAIIVYSVSPILLGILLCSYVRSGNDVERIINVLLCTSVINFVVSAIELATGVNLSYLLCLDGTAVYIEKERLGILRVYGAFINPINNGMYCIFMLIACLYKLSKEKIPNVRLWLWCIYAINWFVLLMTFGRAAIMVAIVANFFLLCRMRIIRINAQWFAILTAVLIVAALMFSIPSISEKIMEMILPFFKLVDDLLGTNIVRSIAGNVVVEGVGNRIDLYEWVPASMTNMWFGEGREAKFSYVVNQYGFRKESIENQYLYELFTHGIISLIGKILLFVSTLLYSLKWTIREWRRKQTGLNTCLLVAYASYFVMLFTVAQNEERKVFYLLLVLQMLYNNFQHEGTDLLRKEARYETT